MIAPPGNLLLLHSDLNPGRRFLLSWWYRARWLFSAPSRWQWPVVEGSRAAFKSISPVPWTSRFPSCSPLLFVSSFLPLLLLLFLPPSTSPFSFAWAQGPRSIEDPMERERERGRDTRLSVLSVLYFAAPALLLPRFLCSWHFCGRASSLEANGGKGPKLGYGYVKWSSGGVSLCEALLSHSLINELKGQRETRSDCPAWMGCSQCQNHGNDARNPLLGDDNAPLLNCSSKPFYDCSFDVEREGHTSSQKKFPASPLSFGSSHGPVIDVTARAASLSTPEKPRLPSTFPFRDKESSWEEGRKKKGERGRSKDVVLRLSRLDSSFSLSSICPACLLPVVFALSASYLSI